MAPTRTSIAVLSALDSKEQSPTQPFSPDFPNTTIVPGCTAVKTNDAAGTTNEAQQKECRASVCEATPRQETVEAQQPRHRPRASPSPSLLRRLRSSSFLAPLLEERVVKTNLVLPPPIHRLYEQREATRLSPVVSPATPTQPQFPASEADVAAPQGDMYNFMFSRREVAQLRLQQRQYLRRQRGSPHAPQLVHLDDVADMLLHEAEINGTTTHTDGEYVRADVDPTTTTSERVAEILSVFCTRGIPQEDYIDAVFQLRLRVLQKMCKAVPTGVVVPTVVHAVVPLGDAVATQQCRQPVVCTPTGERVVTEAKTARAVHWDGSACQRVTYPHPGRPYTFDDLARDPVHLSAEERVTRRAALLHRRTLSEDVYGTPTPYL